MEYTHSQEAAGLEDASVPFLGRWQRLVSTTNWEKGRIIAEWRAALIAAEAPAEEYSDEAWSRRVLHVTGQHVGRLRRVFERFGAEHENYAGLFWSHFQAALDWDDAEMWLEGAVQNGWSVARMRSQRCETLGVVEEGEPSAATFASAEMDEDAPFDEGAVARESLAREASEHLNASSGITSKTDHSGEDSETSEETEYVDAQDESNAVEPAPVVQPFAQLPSLPRDLSDAFEAFKLAILRHRLTNWREVPQADVLASLESLKQFTLAPAEPQGVI